MNKPILTAPATSESASLPEPKLGRLLSELFPVVFGNPPKALKIGIHLQLVESLGGKFSTEAISRFLKNHVSTSEYLTAIAAGGMRWSIAGEPVEEITADEQKHALQWLEHRRLKKSGLLPLRNEDTFTLDYIGRSGLLKKVKASGLRPGKFAKTKGIDLLEFERVWSKAIDEQRERRARRIKLLSEFEQGTMTEEQFAAHHDMPVERLITQLEKARSYRFNSL